MKKRGFITIVALIVATVILIFAAFTTMENYGVLDKKGENNATESTTAPRAALERARSVQDVVNSAVPAE